MIVTISISLIMITISSCIITVIITITNVLIIMQGRLNIGLWLTARWLDNVVLAKLEAARAASGKGGKDMLVFGYLWLPRGKR